MSSTILLVHKEGGEPATVMPFAWRGELSPVAHDIAQSLIEFEAVPAFYEGVIGDLKGSILKLQQDVKNAEKVAQEASELAEFYRTAKVGVLG